MDLPGRSKEVAMRPHVSSQVNKKVESCPTHLVEFGNLGRIKGSKDRRGPTTRRLRRPVRSSSFPPLPSLLLFPSSLSLSPLPLLPPLAMRPTLFSTLTLLTAFFSLGTAAHDSKGQHRAELARRSTCPAQAIVAQYYPGYSSTQTPAELDWANGALVVYAREASGFRGREGGRGADSFAREKNSARYDSYGAGFRID